MSAYISEELRQQVRQADQNRCAYCQTSEKNSGMPLTLDHIIPVAKGGNTTFANLCLACRPCNQFKGILTAAENPLTGELASLFNPRLQKWAEHFQWSGDGTRCEGKSPTGWATIIALRINRDAILTARSRWVSGGWHPPD